MWLKRVFRAELKRSWITMRRYPVETASNLITMAIFSIAAWVGLRAAFFAHKGAFGASAALLWPLVLTGFGAAAASLQKDIGLGTIEQLYLSSPSVLNLLHVRVLVEYMSTLLYVAPLWLVGGFYLGWGALGRWLVVIVVPLALSLYGLGLILAGMTLRYRRLGPLTNVLYFLFLGVSVIALPQKGVWAWLGPFFPMVGVSAMPDWPVGWWLRYPAAVMYLILGMVVFRRLEATAKRRGVIGRY